MRIENIFSPDDNGCSNWISAQRIIDGGLKWTKNGNMRHGTPQFAGSKKYLWEVKRLAGPRSEIVELRTIGFADSNKNINPSIKEEIKVLLRSTGICNFSWIPQNNDDLEVDHRWGHKTHPKYNYINEVEKQKIEDFQLIHKSINSKKRQICKDCIYTKTRPNPPLNKLFVIGNKNLDDINVCDGCYYAQPELYRS